jgi:hypothetical protein
VTGFTTSRFNVRRLIGPGREYHEFRRCTPVEHARKEDRPAGRLPATAAEPPYNKLASDHGQVMTHMTLY